MSIRIFLLDDHEIVRTGLRSMFEAAEGFVVVGEAATAGEALDRIPPTSPHVAILDVRLPDGSGIEVCREIRSNSPEIACVMLTSYADDEALFAAVMAGASGYVLKQIGASDLVGDVRKVAEGQSLLDPALTQRVLEQTARGIRRRPAAGQPHPAGTSHPRPHRRRTDQPADRRRTLPGREDGEELRLEHAGQTRDGAPDPGGQLRHPGVRALGQPPS